MSLPDPNQQGHPHIQETPLRRTSPDFRKAVTRARTPAPPFQGRHRSRPPSTDDNRHLPLSPERIRERRFTLRRRGVDPEEITAFLGRVADELAVARTAVRALALVTQCVDAGEVTVSEEDAQGVRHRVFCDRQLPGGGRCALPTEHGAPCTARTRRPNRARFR